MSGDRPLLGIILMLGFCLLAPLSDAIAKLLGHSIPLGQLLLVRFAVQSLILLPVLLWSGQGFFMSRRVFWLMLIRTVLHILGIGCMFIALRYLPLADTIAIVFVMPFIMLLLGHYILGEFVGQKRIIACSIGFVGTLLVVQPSFAAVGAPAFLPLVVALIFATFMLLTRQIAKDIDPVKLQATSGMLATIILLVIFLVFSGQDVFEFSIVIPNKVETLLLFAIGILGVSAHLLMTWSLRFAPSATLAPIQYLEMPVATLLGWLIFMDLPNGLATIGIITIIASGLYILLHERKLSLIVPAES